MWHIAGVPMFVAPWSPDFSPEQPPLTSAVVPVELRGVPFLLFNRESLGRLATAIGKPVSLAPETERKDNFEVAKVYIRVDLREDLPKRTISGFSNGKEIEISVSYPWLPIKCGNCGKYGHEGNTCHQIVKAGLVWQRKNSRSRSRPSRRGRSSAARNSKHDETAGTVQSGDKAGHKPCTEIGALGENRVNSEAHVEDEPSNSGKETLGKGINQEINKALDSKNGRGKVSLPSGTPPLKASETTAGEGDRYAVQTSEQSPNVKDQGDPHGPHTNTGQAKVKEMQVDKNGDEKPFFLVTHRKSGRKANKN